MIIANLGKGYLYLNITRLECKALMDELFTNSLDNLNITRLECKDKSNTLTELRPINLNITRLECKDCYKHRYSNYTGI